MADDVGVVREATGEHRPAFLELFFDLVFVLALIVLAADLSATLSWLAVARTLILFLAFSLVWALTSWAADTFDLSRPRGQVQVFWVMTGSLVMSVAVPEAFDGRGLLFAIAYLAIQLGSATYLVITGRQQVLRIRNRRILFWVGISGVAWLAGAFVPGTPRTALWGLAILIEYTAAVLGWPTPKLGHSVGWEWKLVGERVAERYRQLLIIALGVSIFTAGLTLSPDNYTSHRIAAFGVAFATVVLMWRIYIYRAGEILPDAIVASTNPSRFCQFAAVGHLVMVAGLILTAAGTALVIDHPLRPADPSWGAIMLSGPALFLVGRSVLAYTVFGRVSWNRPIGIILIGLLVPTFPVLPQLTIMALIPLILLGIAVANMITYGRRPRPPAPPQLRL
ncbi:low temperature requirement protein LtrA [Micromonospora pisi]|uniref:Low temperature requirement protein LtrA n=1 Tax=Micromonospora pisi TaxID=589240 RepID=A0A495JKZ6_9ACTN|nr:low temperature requirement protein A [Micromonospora pisi]RKR89637.1 low temperature requirement protein LtrA [Micromonospora pisi]